MNLLVLSILVWSNLTFADVVPALQPHAIGRRIVSTVTGQDCEVVWMDIDDPRFPHLLLGYEGWDAKLNAARWAMPNTAMLPAMDFLAWIRHVQGSSHPPGLSDELDPNVPTDWWIATLDQTRKANCPKDYMRVVSEDGTRFEVCMPFETKAVAFRLRFVSMLWLLEQAVLMRPYPWLGLPGGSLEQGLTQQVGWAESDRGPDDYSGWIRLMAYNRPTLRQALLKQKKCLHVVAVVWRW